MFFEKKKKTKVNLRYMRLGGGSVMIWDPKD